MDALPAASVQYLAALDVLHINDMLMQRTGGIARTRDEGALIAAIMRPQMVAHYEDADLAAQAVLLIAGIALAHPFLDGNKRTALIAAVAFLYVNGMLVASQGVELGQQVEALVTAKQRQQAQADFAAWMRDRLRPLPETSPEA